MLLSLLLSFIIAPAHADGPNLPLYMIDVPTTCDLPTQYHNDKGGRRVTAEERINRVIRGREPNELNPKEYNSGMYFGDQEVGRDYSRALKAGFRQANVTTLHNKGMNSIVSKADALRQAQDRIRQDQRDGKVTGNPGIVLVDSIVYVNEHNEVMVKTQGQTLGVDGRLLASSSNDVALDADPDCVQKVRKWSQNCVTKKETPSCLSGTLQKRKSEFEGFGRQMEAQLVALATGNRATGSRAAVRTAARPPAPSEDGGRD